MADSDRRQDQRPEKKGWFEDKVEGFINRKADEFVHRNDPPPAPAPAPQPRRAPPPRPMK